MTISSLSAEALEKIRAWQWDRIIEKHEGPEDWASVLHHYDPEFLMISGHPVLLPVGREHHQNITILRTIKKTRQGTGPFRGLGNAFLSAEGVFPPAISFQFALNS